MGESPVPALFVFSFLQGGYSWVYMLTHLCVCVCEKPAAEAKLDTNVMD